MSNIILKGSTSGDVTISVPAEAGSNTLSIPAVTSSVNVLGPAFSAHGPAQTIGNATWTKLTYDTEEFDTDGKFASNKFTPTVAGYYHITGALYYGATSGACVLVIYKNGAQVKRGSQGNGLSGMGMSANIAATVYLDSDDYIELYTYQNTGGNTNTSGGADLKYFQAIYIRS